MPGECTVRTDRTRMSVARLLLRWLTLLALLTATGCVSISYRPALSLPTSERRLEVRARIEEFTDARPQ